MLAKYEPVSYELLRPAQIKALREKTPVAYVPLGTLEWHGVQNPLGVDSLKAHAVCCEAALRHGGVVLPPFYQGWMYYGSWGPEGWGGYSLAFNEVSTMEAAMLGVVRGLVCGGWKMIVGVTGHDVPEQTGAFERALHSGTWHTDVRGFAVYEGGLHTPDADLPYKMDHAGAWETSCMMYVCPQSVDLDELRQRGLCTAEETVMAGAEGIGGKNPLKYASPELGRKIIERMGDLIGRRAIERLEEQRHSGK
jgi:creatinine amidohydrolase